MVKFDSWETLEKALGELDNANSDLETWIEAEKAIVKLAKPKHIPALYKILKTSDYIFPGELVAVHLARLEGMKALPALIIRFSEASNIQDADGLQNVIYKLIITHPNEALPYLLSLVDSPNARLRYNAAWTLGVLYPRVDTKIFEPLLRDIDAEVRAAALGAIAHFKGEEWAFETLIKALDDPVYQVRVWAIVHLGNYNDMRALDYLRKYLNDAQLRRFAQHSIKKLEKGGKD